VVNGKLHLLFKGYNLCLNLEKLSLVSVFHYSVTVAGKGPHFSGCWSHPHPWEPQIRSM